MKTLTFSKWSLGLALAALPFAVGCTQQAADAALPAAAVTNLESAASPATTNTPAPEADATAEQLENAPGQVVATAAPPQDAGLSDPAAEVVKLAQAGVGEGVMLSFVTNSPHIFILSSDAIIYLNDIGVSDVVVTAMIQHDQTLMTARMNGGAAIAPPVYTNPPVSAGSAPEPYPATETPTVTTISAPTQPVNISYFYDSLSPYGNWINLDGYGMCWQPTVVAANPNWQPYCDRGRWVNSDCGWYWASDYSWGWAPFHYGRWFQHRRWGWCWAPDTVWGPSWVSWRYTDDYCGWAPLPPAACYTAGIGFTYYGSSVGFSFGFGLSSGCYVFVPSDRFCHRNPHHYRVPPKHVKPIYDRTVVANEYGHHNNRVVNKGIPPSRIAAATRTNLREVRIRDAADPVSARAGRTERNPRTLPVYRPDPTSPAREVTPRREVTKPGSRDVGAPRPGTPAVNPTRPPANAANSVPRGRLIEPVPVYRNQPPAGNEQRPVDTAGNPQRPPARTIAPPAQRGPERAIPSRGGSHNITPGSSQPAIAPPARTEMPAPNNPPRLTPNREPRPVTSPPPQMQTPAPAPSRPAPQTPGVFHQERPNPIQRQERTYSQPAVPVQRQPTPPSYQAPQAPVVREQPRSFNPPPSYSAPAAPAPRMETRPSQPAPAAPPPQRSQSGSGGRSSRDDGGNNSRRNR